MKALITYLLVFMWQVGICQNDTIKELTNATVKSDLICKVIKNVNSTLLPAAIKSAYYSLELRQRFISGEGIDYNDFEFQDTVYKIDSLEVNLIKTKVSSLKNRALIINGGCMNFGKINRRSILYYCLTFDTVRNVRIEPLDIAYIYIDEPIAGWDIIQVLLNNGSKSRFGVEKNPCLSSNIYIPIQINYRKTTEQTVSEYWLYNYVIAVNFKGQFNFTLQSKTKLNICN